jgi:hypothetical protein
LVEDFSVDLIISTALWQRELTGPPRKMNIRNFSEDIGQTGGAYG